MQRLRFALHRWLSASALALSLLFAGSVRADLAEPSAVIDDSLTTIGQYYAILCNTCATTNDYVLKAKTQYPRVRDSVVYVYNLASGQVRSVFLNWDTEVAAQTGGYEIPNDPRLVTYVTNAADLYRRNGNSLNFTAIVRADGSVYMKFQNGSTFEIRAARPRTLPSSVTQPKPTPVTRGQVTPGRNTPIDLRGYHFPPYFDLIYPNFPDTSYDLAFGDQPGSIDGFVHDYFSTLGQNPGQIFDPDSMAGVGGAHKLTEQVTGQISLFVPMKDGGYARVRYDTATGDVLLRQIIDPSGIVLPNGYGNAMQFYGNRTWSLGNNANFAVGAFEEWAARNGISVVVTSVGWGTGGSVTCSSRSVNEVTCTIHPN